MNRKQFLILVLALVVLGGVGLALFWQDIAAYRSTGAKIGARLLPNLKLADVAYIQLRDARHVATLARKDNRWVVQERGDYPANFQEISDAVIKLIELKVVQSEEIGASLLPRVALAPPPEQPSADVKDEQAKQTGTRVEMKDAAGKTLATLTVGKVVLKKDPGNPLPNAVNGVPAGRYVQVAGAKSIAVVSDPLDKLVADPAKWLDKTFFKADRVKTLSVADNGGGWKITRDEEWGQWKFAAGGGNLDASAAVGAANQLSNWTFEDVATTQPDAGDKPVTVVAETFDRVTYTFRITPRKAGGYFLNGNVEGEPAQTRTPEKDEKPADKERRDKEYADTLKRLQDRLARERALSKWTYVMDAKTIAPLLKQRGDLVAAPPAAKK
ncbi:MAG TPA: DUF4340 domain-containing protein [Burkholderiales bacterium]|nr:DUF4340 domain-containing protein [Burkholderiales bacterium]